MTVRFPLSKWTGYEGCGRDSLNPFTVNTVTRVILVKRISKGQTELFCVMWQIYKGIQCNTNLFLGLL